jgi:hypothetical protein
VKASRARVSQSALKTGGGAARMVHVVSSRILCRGQVEDGRVDVMSYIEPYYPCFVVFFVLDNIYVLVF